MSSPTIQLRHATLTDLEDINHVIEAAVMTWDLPERVKRLSLPSYRYTELDFKHLDIVVAENINTGIIGIAAWEEADSKDAHDGQKTMLLHGIYIAPQYYRQGIGQQLFKWVEQAIIKQSYNTLLVKAQADADNFFLAQGMQRVDIEDNKRDYANRFLKTLPPLTR